MRRRGRQLRFRKSCSATHVDVPRLDPRRKAVEPGADRPSRPPDHQALLVLEQRNPRATPREVVPDAQPTTTFARPFTLLASPLSTAGGALRYASGRRQSSAASGVVYGWCDATTFGPRLAARTAPSLPVNSSRLRCPGCVCRPCVAQNERRRAVASRSPCSSPSASWQVPRSPRARPTPPVQHPPAGAVAFVGAPLPQHCRRLQ